MTTAVGLRRGLLALSGLGVVGTLVELAILRHWHSLNELTPWLVLVTSGILLPMLAFRPSRKVVIWARWTGVVLAMAGVYGLTVHILANMNSAPLDGTIGATWDGLSVWRQVWLASTGGVGPAPPLSAASIAPTGLAIALATYRHEALGRASMSRPSIGGEVPASTEFLGRE